MAVTPSAEAQLQFLQHLQQLFEDGDFVATYKYALLMALAELAVEQGGTSEALELPMTAIGEKFAELYWAQTVPYASGTHGSSPIILFQNQGNQAAVVNGLLRLRAAGAKTIGDAKQQPDWPDVVREIARTVAAMPIQYLQNVGGTQIPFLYDYPLPVRGKVILKPGVVFTLRTFHPLIQQLARAGWLNHVRQNQRNHAAIGQVDDLEQFMFGTSRVALATVVPLLNRLQSKKCFYCGELLRGTPEVDHFIPWIKYPRDLAHNFVLAHAECNRRKSDMLAAERHLDRWVTRNLTYGAEITGEMKGFAADVTCSHRVALWAYEQAVAAGGYGWVEKRRTEQLSASCLDTLA
ncbi:HNH endonuclease [Candidatus Kaiserbacteria bacterium]|nr:HNH endonuclease [Candidatus Kaiserbacteria bacterium]